MSYTIDTRHWRTPPKEPGRPRPEPSNAQSAKFADIQRMEGMALSRARFSFGARAPRLLGGCSQAFALIAVLILFGAIAHAADSPSFAEFDRRAHAGEKLNVVFFGASLT